MSLMRAPNPVPGRLTDTTLFTTEPSPLKTGVCGRNPAQPNPVSMAFSPGQIAGIAIGVSAALVIVILIFHSASKAWRHRSIDAAEKKLAQFQDLGSVSLVGG